MDTRLMIEIFGSMMVVVFAPIILCYCYWWARDIGDYRRAVREAREYYLATEDELVEALRMSEHGATLDTKMAMQKLIYAEDVIEDERTNEHYHLLIPMQIDLLDALQ